MYWLVFLFSLFCLWFHSSCFTGPFNPSKSSLAPWNSLAPSLARHWRWTRALTVVTRVLTVVWHLIRHYRSSFLGVFLLVFTLSYILTRYVHFDIPQNCFWTKLRFKINFKYFSEVVPLRIRITAYKLYQIP